MNNNNNNEQVNDYKNILILGLDNSGKSTIIARLKGLKLDELTEIYPTPFMNVENLIIDGKKLRFIEISGNLRYRKYWQMFYHEVQGIIFVVDGTDFNRIKIVKELVEVLESQLEKKMNIVFLVNKQDVEGALNKNEVKEILNLEKIETKFVWSIRNCIGYTDTTVKEAIHFLLNGV